MDLLFLGTRGGIKARSKAHCRHASLLVKQSRHRVMIDCGADWLSHLSSIKPTAIVITHAHPDHVGGLKSGAPCPVYATADTFTRIKRYPIDKKIIVFPNIPFTVGSLTLTAFSLEHSLNAPAVGYRITQNGSVFFYAPDLVSIIDKNKALPGVSLYIGDGAIITRKLLIRQHTKERTGHAPIAEQLSWCKDAGITQALITHCGTEIVTGDPRLIESKIELLKEEYGVDLELATDGMLIKSF